ncbi:beta(1,3)galactosyltransferase EpsH [Streptococcus lutetiensis]|uniref:PssE/Cps14G family polysaccharide biosynthesis glycosyltransferase n=1 Tax=Streptococcus lutetiensis TaxID=150055 RepID=UPI001BDA9CAE|nr:PssE/Cps14G family polysaccharide biosynthesis glycosyltransferase [Streptococcus lutetiensis]MBT0948028.1 beta(1,3)galactosyltransferase EpsH [Streptococcus lutetiensis]
MIFVTVGTQKFQFNRLLQAIDDYSRKTDEEIFGQIGNSTYFPQNYEYKHFLDKNEFRHKMESSDLIITHSGVATIIEALKLNKPVIVVPRLEMYGEHVDNHQVQIAESFDESNLVLKCSDLNQIIFLVDRAKKQKFKKYVSQRNGVINIIEDYLEKNV